MRNQQGRQFIGPQDWVADSLNQDVSLKTAVREFDFGKQILSGNGNQMDFITLSRLCLLGFKHIRRNNPLNPEPSQVLDKWASTQRVQDNPLKGLDRDSLNIDVHILCI